jgi:hypothetical protein
VLDRRRCAPTLVDARPVAAELTRISPQIEHRLFSFVTGNWRGKTLTSYRTIVELIGATTTETGLKVRAEWDHGYYPTGTQITDTELAALPLKPDKWHGEWNYTLKKPRAASK